MRHSGDPSRLLLHSKKLVCIQTNKEAVIVAKLNAAARELVLMEIRFKEIHKILCNLLNEKKAAVFVIFAWRCHFHCK